MKIVYNNSHTLIWHIRLAPSTLKVWICIYLSLKTALKTKAELKLLSKITEIVDYSELPMSADWSITLDGVTK